MSDDVKLNPDAIYAAMAYTRAWSKRPDVRTWAEDQNEDVAAQWSGIITQGGSVRAIPRPKITPELCESIFPGEPDSVEYGLRMAAFILSGIDPQLAERLAASDDECAPAIRRFLVDEIVKH